MGYKHILTRMMGRGQNPAVAAQATSQPRHIVPIFLNTIPKSGSIFLLETLKKNLGLEYLNVSPGYFPLDLLLHGQMQTLEHGNLVTQSHVPAHPINISQINRYLDRFWLHLRDPRQACLSWTHYLERYIQTPDALIVFNPPLPEGYFSLSLGEKLDWQIHTYLPSLVQWTAGWIKAIDDKNVRIPTLITTFEDMAANPEPFLARLLAFYNLPEHAFTFSEGEKTHENNFRKGLIDEWRTAFSAEQQETAAALLPADLCDRLGWPPR